MPDLLTQLADAIQQKAGGAAVGPYNSAGVGGIWGVAGLEREVISTRIQPQGLAGRLPARGTKVMFPEFAYITAFDVDSGTDPATDCADAKVAGPIKTCIQTAQFGLYQRKSREFAINMAGQQVNRGYFEDLYLVNSPLGNDRLGNNGIVTPQSASDSTPNLFNEAQMRMTEIGQSFQNLLVRQVYQGNPSNNNAGGGYKEFPGLDILIGTGKVDAHTQAPCPALDSDIKNFNYRSVDDLTSSGDIVNVLTYEMRYLRHNAEASGIFDCKWIITMRRELFYEITAVWPCSYLTYRCTFRDSDTTRLNVDAGDQIAMRDAMRAGRYLLIDGEEVEVVLDDGILEENRADNGAIPIAGFASDIYIIPLSGRGMAFTYWEYYDFSAVNAAMDVARTLGFAGNWYWTDGGKYLWVLDPPVKWCITWQGKIMPRVILRTPHLAGRVLNVSYTPLQHTRDPFPDDLYFVNGGVSGRPAAPSLFTPWGYAGLQP